MTTGFTISFGCVLVMALLPVVCAGLAKSGMMGKPRKDGGYDNDNPRQWLSSQTDWRARANNSAPASSNSAWVSNAWPWPATTWR